MSDRPVNGVKELKVKSVENGLGDRNTRGKARTDVKSREQVVKRKMRSRKTSKRANLVENKVFRQ